ncbi:MAG: prepilin peptidase [Candidatus Hadarchaeaceae archaeon]
MILINSELIPAAVAVVGSIIATYTDLRNRIIPNELNFTMIFFGIGYGIFLGLIRWDFFVMVSGILGATISFVVGYLLWKTGGWAGGDVKLFTALGALLYRYRMPAGNPAYPVPLTIIFNSILIVLPFLLVYFLFQRARGESTFYATSRITELREGVIPAELIYEKKGRIYRSRSPFYLKRDWDRIYANPLRAAGLTRYQVGVLRRLAREGKIRDELRIKRGMPFAPALAAGTLATVLFGDIYWQFMVALFGYV